MKKTLLILALAVAFSTSSQAAKPKGSDSIWIENKEASFKQGVVDINVSLPVLDSDRGDEALLKNFNLAVIHTMVQNPPVPYNAPVNTLADLRLFVATIASALNVRGRETTMTPSPYQYFTTWSTVGNSLILSTFIKRYVYSGGAHGKTIGTFLNFESKTGKQIDLRNSIADTSRLLDLAAKYFCKERHLPLDAMQLQTGLYCELTELPMPREIGLSGKGLVLYYNQYEIAPYSLGAIEITIPYSEINDLWKGQLKDIKMKGGGAQNYNANTKRVNTSVQKR